MRMNKFTFATLILYFWLHIRFNAAEVTYSSPYCVSGNNYTIGSAYQRNLNSLFSNLSSKSYTQKYYNSTSGVFPNKVYGLYQCRADVSPDTCSECIQAATQKIVQECPLKKEAYIWYYECMLRYSNRSIFSSYEIFPFSYEWWRANVTNYGQFAPVLASTMESVINQAATGTALLGHFATAHAKWSLFETLYCLAQCLPDISELDCRNCLNEALSVMITTYNSSLQVKVFFPSCQLRYDSNKQFYRDTPHELQAPAPSNSSVTGLGKSKVSRSHVLNIALGILVVILIVLVTVLIYHLCYKRRMMNETGSIRMSRKDSHVTNFENDREGFTSVQSLLIDQATLEMATNRFSDANKLGQGGFGSVYKGTLPNRIEIAVKRLSREATHGAEQFQNEVMFVAKLQHRNLVRLLGYCQTPNEKLLVYEYVPNKSLDLILFDPETRGLLDWSARYKIIHGIARGLQYLHEDSRLKIVHRDLKASNILLDADMNPKISDFGLARNFDVNQNQDQTSRLAGTFGYMAPEYLEYGEITTKLDVYSFGVLVIEIITGQKISNRQPGLDENLLTYAWRHWNEGTPLEVVDTSLGDSYASNEIIRCVHLGLLCVQGDIEERPSMLSILFYLNSSYDLPTPQRPTVMKSSRKGSSSGHSNKSGSSYRTSGQQSDKSISRSMHSFSGNEASTH